MNVSYQRESLFLTGNINIILFKLSEGEAIDSESISFHLKQVIQYLDLLNIDKLKFPSQRINDLLTPPISIESKRLVELLREIKRGVK